MNGDYKKARRGAFFLFLLALCFGGGTLYFVATKSLAANMSQLMRASASARAIAHAAASHCRILSCDGNYFILQGEYRSLLAFFELCSGDALGVKEAVIARDGTVCRAFCEFLPLQGAVPFGDLPAAHPLNDLPDPFHPKKHEPISSDCPIETMSDGQAPAEQTTDIAPVARAYCAVGGLWGSVAKFADTYTRQSGIIGVQEPSL